MRNILIVLTVKKQKKGFTLIELLVVIAIIAILSIVVVLTLNPAEMLRRSRDSNRTSDLSTMRTAIGLYLADVTSTNMGVAGTCYLQYAGGVAPTTIYEFATTTANEAGATTAYTSAASGCKMWFNSQSVATWIASSNRSVSAGWIPIDLTKVSSGIPLGQWPVDPSSDVGTSASGINAGGNFYSYIPGASNNQYKIAAKMESAAYAASGTSDVESTDGGVDQFMYEVGSGLQL